MAELVYIDYPDLLLHARRLGAVQLGRAKSTRQASSRRIQDPNYRFDLKTLYGHFVGIDYPHLSRGTLFSSSAPLQHRVIKPAQEAGFRIPTQCLPHTRTPRHGAGFTPALLLQDAHECARKSQDIVTIVATPQFLSAACTLNKEGFYVSCCFWGHAWRGHKRRGIEFDELDPFLWLLRPFADMNL